MNTIEDGVSKAKEKLSGMNSNQELVKYALPIAVVGFGLFLGGHLAQGVYAGVLTTAGFWILTEKLRTFYPSAYNWLIDHAVEADFMVSGAAACFLGFTVTGIIAAAVVNLLVSVVLENYRTSVGKVKGVDTITGGEIFQYVCTKTKEGYNALKGGLSNNEEEFEGETFEGEVANG